MAVMYASPVPALGSGSVEWRYAKQEVKEEAMRALGEAVFGVEFPPPPEVELVARPPQYEDDPA